MGFTYLAADLRTNQILSELPLQCDNFGSKFKGIGDLSGYLPLGNAEWNMVTLPDDVRGFILDSPGEFAHATQVGVVSSGDLTLSAEVTMPDWTPSGRQVVMGNYLDVNGSKGYYLAVDPSGVLVLKFSSDGTSTTTVNSTVSTGFVDGSRHFIRAKLVLNNGAGNSSTQFFTSADGITWTQIGVPVLGAVFANTFTSAVDFSIGADSDGVTNQFIGTVWYASIHRGTTLIASWDPLNVTGSTRLTDTAWTDAQGNTWALVGGAFTGTAGASYVIDKANIANGTIPDRTALYVDFDGVLVWGGIIWGRKYNSKSKHWDIDASEFGSFYQRQVIDQTLQFGTNYSSGLGIAAPCDQAQIARYFISFIASITGGDIGVILDTLMTGRIRDRTYWWYDFKNVWDALLQLSDVIDGFDFGFDVAYNGSQVPSKSLNLAYPFRGRSTVITDVIFDYPGTIFSYDWPEDGQYMATKSHSKGQGDGETALRTSLTNTALIDAGYPLLQQFYSYSDISVQQTLDDHTVADLKSASEPLTTPRVILRADGQQRLGSYITGDFCRLQILDERFPSGLDASYRIIGWEVHPKEYTVDLDIGTVASTV